MTTNDQTAAGSPAAAAHAANPASTAVTASVLGINPLIGKQIRPPYNWHESRSLWDAATTASQLESVLHTGFNVRTDKYAHNEPAYSHEDVIVFYFGVANGWAAAYDELRVAGDTAERLFSGWDKSGCPILKTAWELRTGLARKAFDMLCTQFFCLNGHDEHEECWRMRHDMRDAWQGYWAHEIATEKLFPCITEFFGIQKLGLERGFKIRNLSSSDDRISHNEELARSFLVNLAGFLWGWKEDDIPTYLEQDTQNKVKAKNLAMRSRIETAKPWMVEVLSILGRLDVLQQKQVLSQACLEKLAAIAMRSRLSRLYDHPVTADRLVTTLDEARYAGSPAAWLLARYETHARVHARLTQIRDAQAARAQAEEQLAELTAT
jgi:hypothetical protein